MKKLYFTISFLLLSFIGFAQTDAISYQAVILNPDSQQLPGNDAVATILPDTEISLRFTIINDEGFNEYQEVHTTKTDAFGMVNLYIGQGRNSGFDFDDVLWNGTPKDLLVEVDFYNLGSFVQLSAESLTFTPQAYHRDIIATGDLDVDGTATFKDDFILEGEATINNNLSVTGDIEIGEDLTVDGTTNLNSSLSVNNESTTNLTGSLDVDGLSSFHNDIVVDENATVEGDMNVNGNTILSGTATLVGDVVVGGNMAIAGEQSVAGDVSFERALTVNLSGTFNNALNVLGRTDLNGRLTVGGATIMEDALSVAGETIISDNVTATGNGLVGGTFDVLGKTTVGGNFTVNGRTSLNDDLKVDGGSTSLLTGPVMIDGKTDINNSLFVNNSSPTDLGGTLHVVKNAVFDDDVLIDGMLTVNNNLLAPNIVISGDGNLNGGHVALFENTGGTNADGIAIRINNPSLSAGNNFVTFFGQGDYMAGRIESFDANTDMANLPNDVTNTTGAAQNQGIVYGSKGADYAEWLEKEDGNDSFVVGEVVGIKGGKISRNTVDADHVLTISLAPIVLGNMPAEENKDAYEKVGFMGQVPALVLGKVALGDYIVASGKNDGYAIAIAPEKMTIKDLRSVIGKAWSAHDGDGKSLINVSVGLKSSEWATILEGQEERLQLLESKLKAMESLSEKMKSIEAKVDALDMN